nr:MAG TPA: hypothetical protein [Caudoviricetes sp.]
MESILLFLSLCSSFLKSPIIPLLQYIQAELIFV